MAAKTPDTTLIALAELLGDPDLSRKEAISLLGRINRREADIPEARIYMLLEQINIEDMSERPHRGHAKQADRSFGRKMRVKRTGSRRG